jgi:glycyl-tRNA synthetase beta chain
MSLRFLLEIGVEEVPDWMVEPALGHLKELFSAVLAENNLGGQVDSMDATPRRLVLRASGLAEKQVDEVKAVAGPPVSAGAGAVAGFAKKMGASVEQLDKVQTPKGEYYSFNRSVEGRRTLDILAEALPVLIPRIHFPKTMYWTGKGGPRFIRPIRWLVALLGEEVVPFEIAGVRSSNITSGHRLLGASNVEVSIDNFADRLQENGVVLSAVQRRAMIEAGLGPNVRKDDALLTTLVYLTEQPSTVRGSFDRKFLELPQEILTTVMRHHQRYFSVETSEGRLAPEFVAVTNTNADPDGLIRTGNERVLRARFNDARFFWDVDLRRQLSDRLEDLKNVTFQAKLGSYHQKTERVVKLAEHFAEHVGANTSMASRGALLSKCDLTTEMVKELTELQGIVGGLYAREQGEPEEIWRSVYEHYKPVSMEDSIPSTRTGQVVALADKADTLRGCFDIGLIPTGSRDPFALRRAAQGVVKIIVEGGLRLKLRDLVGDNPQLREFMVDRVKYYFREVRGFKYDEVNAVLAAGAEDLVDVEARLQAIQQVRPTEDFEPVAASFKRIANILRQAQFTSTGTIDAGLLEPGPELDLHSEFLRTRDVVFTHRKTRNYGAALEAIASLRPKVDTFFDKVLVNAPEERVRHNRLLLLSSLLTEFSAIADFAEIVTGS